MSDSQERGAPSILTHAQDGAGSGGATTGRSAQSGAFAIKLSDISRIWRTKGTLELDEDLSAEEAFTRLAPLFQTDGTQASLDGDTLSYKKRNPAAQDKLATFTSGTLRIAQDGGRARLHFDLSSTALLLVFLAPLLFLGFAQLAVTINAWEKASTEAVQSDDKTKDGAKDGDKDKPVPKLHPIDAMLGAPAPEDPSKKKDEDKDEEEGRHSPDRAYVLAGLFFLIYLVGRVLEPWLIKRTFRQALSPSGLADAPLPAQPSATEG